MFPRRCIVCSYSNFSALKESYPAREVIADLHCMGDEFYVETNSGFLTVRMRDRTVWRPIIDDDGWPIGLVRLVWPRKKAHFVSK